MSDQDARHRESRLRDVDDDDLARLIRSAGARPPPPAAHYDAVLAVSRSAWQAKVRARSRARRLSALAAAVALAAALGLLYQTLPRSPAPVATAAVLRGEVAVLPSAGGGWRPLDGAATLQAGDTIRTGEAGRAAFALAGGTSLRLDVGTELRIDDETKIRLAAGAVYVDSDGGAEVRIETTLGTVRDVGTRFEVRTLEDTLRLRVRSGSVEVRSVQAPGTVRGAAGEELLISAAGPVQRRAFPARHAEWAWAEALAAPPELDTPTVLGYLRWIARETGRDLQFDSPATETRAAAEQWLGDAEGLTPPEVLDAIVATSDFAYELTEDGGLLISRTAGQ